MDISKTTEAGKIILSLDDRLDADTAPLLEAAVNSALAESANLRLDFTKCDYVSSAGIRVLLLGHRAAKAKGGVMEVANVPESVMDVFKMVAVDTMLRIV